jgi:hypothetical protein
MELAVFIATFVLVAYFLCEEVGLGISTIFSRLPKTVRENRRTLFWTAALLTLPFVLSRLTSEISKSSEARLPTSMSSVENLVIGIITTSSAIFVGNSLLRRSQRRQDEEKAISRVVFSLMRVAGKLEGIGEIIIASSSSDFLSEGSLKNISGKCNEMLEYSRECLAQASDIHASPKWYSLATEIDRVNNRVSLMLDQGFALSRNDSSEGLSIGQASLIYIEIVFPLEMEIYDLLISSRKSINSEYWNEIASIIIKRLKDKSPKNRGIQIWKFSLLISSRPDLPKLKNFSSDYILSKLNGKKDEILRKLEGYDNDISLN